MTASDIEVERPRIVLGGRTAREIHLLKMLDAGPHPAAANTKLGQQRQYGYFARSRGM